MNYNIQLTNKFFGRADELENYLKLVGQKITNFQYKLGNNDLLDDAGRKIGECRVTENVLTFSQYFSAGHDVNGNRRAIILQYDLNGDVIALYKYNNKFPSALLGCVPLPDVKLSYPELRERIKQAKESNVIIYEGE